jgi:hypothetical protein
MATKNCPFKISNSTAYVFFSQLVSIPVNVPMHKADQDNGKNFDQCFECPGTFPPPGFEFYQDFLEISMIKELQLLII